jgi:hypothetical protein
MRSHSVKYHLLDGLGSMQGRKNTKWKSQEKGGQTVDAKGGVIDTEDRIPCIK